MILIIKLINCYFIMVKLQIKGLHLEKEVEKVDFRSCIELDSVDSVEFQTLYSSIRFLFPKVSYVNFMIG